MHSAIVAKIVDTLKSWDFWQGTIAAAALAALGLVGSRLWELVMGLVRTEHGFDISGYWIGKCVLPSYDAPQLEIWRYARRGETVAIKFFAYDPAGHKPTKWRGGGVIRAKALSGYYFLLDKYTWESGVIALQLSGNGLRGVYSQFDPKLPDEPLYVSSTAKADQYFQVRAPELPRSARWKMFLGRAPFDTFAEVERIWHEVAPKPSPPASKSGAG